jgi:hypothetical protein
MQIGRGCDTEQKIRDLILFGNQQAGEITQIIGSKNSAQIFINVCYMVSLFSSFTYYLLLSYF